MSLFDKLTETDKRMIDAYISEYASGKHADLDYLLRYWDSNKSEYLYKLFGNQFQISKAVEWAKPLNTMVTELYKLNNNRSSATFKFRRAFDRFLWENRLTLGNEYYKLQYLLDDRFLLNTSYDDDDEFSVNTPTGHEIKVQKGCRPMRILSRIAKAYGNVEYLEEFQTEISMILNQKKLKGTLTLSIHPMDYMTMSDNNSDWSSCMSWMEGGCYCRGTVEMMNSPMVVVAYLASDKDMSVPGGYSWNNKKWRELFIITPEIITGVKGYPYQNEEFVKTVDIWLKELAETNLGWSYDDFVVQYQHHRSFDYSNPTTGEVIAPDARIWFHTNTMYNDFGTIDCHYGIFGTNTDKDIDITYSGPEICMQCGADDVCFDGEGDLICEDCDRHCYCYNCGDRVESDDEYWLDGEAYCEYCYDQNREEDDLTGEEHHHNNLRTVYFIANDENLTGDDFLVAPSIRVYSPDMHDASWVQYFNDSPKRFAGTWSYRLYVTPEMCKDYDAVCELFDIVNER